MTRRAAALVAAVALGGCGSSTERGNEARGGLVWTDTPRLLVARGLPDRVIQGTVRNESLERLRIRTEDVVVEDDRGRWIEASVVFADGFTKPLYPQDVDMRLPDGDRQRLGQIVELAPGQEAPLTVGFRQPAGAAPPARLRYQGGFLEIGRAEPVTPSTERPRPRGN